MVEPHNGILPGKKKEWPDGTCDNKDESQNCYAERCQTKKKKKKVYIVWFHLYKILERKH